MAEFKRGGHCVDSLGSKRTVLYILKGCFIISPLSCPIYSGIQIPAYAGMTEGIARMTGVL